MEGFIGGENSGSGLEGTKVRKVVGSNKFDAAGVGVGKILV